jgi:putative zinc finger/helix-turn-helix YgiT family protein
MVGDKVDISKCVVCGSREVVASDEPVMVTVKDVNIMVGGVAHETCRSCGEEYFSGKMASLLQRKAVSQYREEYSLLSGDEVRAIRKQLGLTQAQLERLLGIATNTVTRWENEVIFQSRPVDLLLRLIRDAPSVPELLSEYRLAREPQPSHARNTVRVHLRA